jgi:hypothetical protein
MKPRYGLVTALLLCVPLGCSRTPVASDPQPLVKENPPPPRAVEKPRLVPDDTMEALPPPGQYGNPEVVKNKEGGVLRGVVIWKGPEPLHPTPRLRIDPATHGVAQTVIQLRSLGKKAAPPAEPVRLVAERGEYRPHIVLAQKGATIELRSVEDRADFQASGAATFSEAIKRGDKRVFSLSSPGLIEVRSELHPDWAPAYVWVLDGAPGTLTAADGQFRLPPVARGEYELVLWHEDWHTSDPAPARTVQVPIKLGPGEGAEVRWTLAER